MARISSYNINYTNTSGDSNSEYCNSTWAKAHSSANQNTKINCVLLCNGNFSATGTVSSGPHIWCGGYGIFPNPKLLSNVLVISLEKGQEFGHIFHAE